jgi:hypothetical protein
MFLFYSDRCNHCRMLLDTIQRLQVKSITLVSVDSLRSNGKKVPPQIHSVPALMLMPSKQILFGKQVFDYLLLPGKGVLTMGTVSQKGASLGTEAAPTEPQAFTMHMSSVSGDNYAFIEDGKNGHENHRRYAWSSIEAVSGTESAPTNASLQSNTRVKKEMLDLEEFKARRAEDLNVVINTNVTPPPAVTY